MRIAMIGTRGVPARYGGFETAVEEIGARLVEAGHDVTVYCRKEHETVDSYRGMTLVHLPALRLKQTETLSRTFLSAVHVMTRSSDMAFVFNAANAPVLPLLRARRVPTALHVDGLEWRRGKWGRVGRRYYLASERIAVRWASSLIADSRAIGEYYMQRYGRRPEFIAYGAPILQGSGQARIQALSLSARGYHLVVARLEPENNVHVIIEAFRRTRSALPLLIVGGAPYGDRYIASLRKAAEGDDRIRFLGGLWDQDLLDELYSNAQTYIHGHSVGGTNPSLLRAMGAGAMTIAADNVFNREVLGDAGRYFTPDSLSTLIENCDDADLEHLRIAVRDRAASAYRWDDVAARYEALAIRLARR